MNKILNDSLSDYIKLIRFKAQKSQKEVAKELNISRNTYSIWERNPVQLKLDTLIEIGNILNNDIIIFFNQYVAECNEEN